MNIFAKWTVSSCKSEVYSMQKVCVAIILFRFSSFDITILTKYNLCDLSLNLIQGYGIGTPRDSPYRDLVTSAILKVI